MMKDETFKDDFYCARNPGDKYEGNWYEKFDQYKATQKANEAGIAYYKAGHILKARNSFATASLYDYLGELDYNIAITNLAGENAGLKWENHGPSKLNAEIYFKLAIKRANGNKAILESKILLCLVQLTSKVENTALNKCTQG
jgi:hypothetical protein